MSPTPKSPKAPKSPDAALSISSAFNVSAPVPAHEPLRTGLILPGALPAVAPMPGTLQVKIKLLSPSAKVPTYGTDGAACFDLYATDTVAIAPGRAVTVKTDVAFEVPDGYVLQVHSRSGHGYKQGLRLVNSTGIVDSDYRGEVMVRLHNDSSKTAVIELGERVAQALILPVPRIEFLVVDELSATVRGAAGFGSTGK